MQTRRSDTNKKRAKKNCSAIHSSSLLEYKEGIATHDDEILGVVDEKDNVIGQESRFELYRRNSFNFRVMNTFLGNDSGQIWIPRRGPDKALFPLCLDMSMGGHLPGGESYEKAFKRETAAELNLDIDKVEWSFLGRLTPHNHGVSAFMRVYEIQTDQSPAYKMSDFVESFWPTPKEILEKIRNGDRTKDDLPKLVRYYYAPIDGRTT